jgi:hypothetical protein
MPILTAIDQPTYFPLLTQTGFALDGLINLAQAMCESSYGANRPLELQPFQEIISINPQYRVGVLSYYPIANSPALAVESLVTALGNRFGRTVLDAWQPLAAGDYRLDAETGELWLMTRATKARVAYSAGLDFAGDSAEVKRIKSIAGQVLTYFANYKVGLDSYLSNPVGDTGVESYNLVRPDQYLSALLLPLRVYQPRRSLG